MQKYSEKKSCYNKKNIDKYVTKTRDQKATTKNIYSNHLLVPESILILTYNGNLFHFPSKNKKFYSFYFLNFVLNACVFGYR